MDQMYSVLDQNTVSYSIKFVLILRLEKIETISKELIIYNR